MLVLLLLSERLGTNFESMANLEFGTVIEELDTVFFDMKVPGRQGDYSFLNSLEGPRRLANPVVVITPPQRNSTHNTVYKIQQLRVLSGEPGPELLLDTETRDPPVARDTSTIICFLH
ncbi:hypothetical protein llap_2403 [Limosa lapponica baueri]|uniref:Uncharacterized protein n=1 Tax=Limosa lapponica baueri TaxID=1758121 RepID=A0A2I0UMN0_LIMLA|nr:hypothetical protein llap_2403 [Limosa lapponica baueri]